VNFFLHDQVHEAPRVHRRQLYVLRGVVLLLTVMTIVAAYQLAYLVLGSRDSALLAAGLCAFLPQLSFFAAKVHPDVTATLLGTVAYWTLAARAHERVSRVPSWLVLGAVMAMTPFADRQAYLLLAVIPVGLVLLERSWPRRLMMIGAMAIVGGSILFLERDAFGGDLTTWVGPLLPSYRGLLWSPEALRYGLFEALPKNVFGFVGWFNSSILLPAWMYALVVVLGVVGLASALVAGVAFLRRGVRDRMTPQILSIVALVLGVTLTVSIVAYTNLFVVRAPDGRYLFPVLAPLMILWVIGMRALATALRTTRWCAWAVAAVVGVVVACAWWLDWATWVTDGIAGNHYGNQPHLIATVRLIALGGVCLPLVLLLVQYLRMPVRFTRAPWNRLGGARGLFGLAWALNLALLFAFVRPLYTPLDAAGYGALIQEELQRSELTRAAEVAQVASQAYPQSADLKRRADSLRFMNPDVDELRRYFQHRLETGSLLSSRDEVMAFARVLRVRPWADLHTPMHTLPALEAQPALDEAPLVTRLVLERQLGIAPTRPAADLLRAARVRITDRDVNEQAQVEGFTVHEAAERRCEVVVYFRPKKDRWPVRYPWLHVEDFRTRHVTVLEPTPPRFLGWEPGELAWETFYVQSPAEADISFGIGIMNSPGTPLKLATLIGCGVEE
jgi:hypothetical protein